MTETSTLALKAFSDREHGLQIAWDSHSLGTLKECPKKYEYSIIQGFRPRAVSVHLTFGIYYHEALERYDHARARGLDHDDALDEALRYCLEATVVRLPSGSWRPWTSDEPTKNRETLIRTVVWYLDQFQEDPAETIILSNGKPAVELSFRFEIDHYIAGQPAMLCGHLDRLVNFNDDIWVADRKTTKTTIDGPSSQRYFAGFSPDNQMSLYSLASKVVYQTPAKGVIIDAAQVAVTFSRFRRGFAKRNNEQLEEWYRDTIYWLGQAERFAEQGYWPMNDKSCGNYGGCPYRDVCAVSGKSREEVLKTFFHYSPWDPLDTRGDI